MQASLERLESRIAPADLALGTMTIASGDVTFGPGDALSATLNDPAGSGQLVVTGAVALGGAMLNLAVTDPLNDGEDFLLITNDGLDAVAGTFAALPEGAVVSAAGGFFKISYTGGDGNDVELSALVPDLEISGNRRTATFTDEDGDRVTMKTTIGDWRDAQFALIPTGDVIGGARLVRLGLAAGFDGTNLMIKASPGAFGGNGLVNVGAFDAETVRPASVLVDGDVGALSLGGGSGAGRAIQSIVVHSLGRFDDFTLPPGESGNRSTFCPVRNFLVRTDVVTGELTFTGKVGRLEVGGSVLDAVISVGGRLGALVVQHDFAGSGPGEAQLRVAGAASAPAGAVDTAIGSIRIGGRVEMARILAGYDVSGAPVNADASIGPVLVGGMWVASTMHAGTGPGLDGLDGTGDDARLAGPGVRDADHLTAQIASVVIAGQGAGTFASTSDNFGIVSEWIRKARIGGIQLGFFGGARSPDDRFFVAATGPGGDGSLSDFAILETVA